MAVDIQRARNDLAQLGGLLPLDVSAHVCLAAMAKGGGVFTLNRLQLSANLARNFAQAALDHAAELSQSEAAGDKLLVAYDAGTPSVAHEIEVDEIVPGSTQENVLNSLDQIAQVPIYQGDLRRLTQLNFYSVSIIVNATGVTHHFFRRYSATRQLTKSNRIYALAHAGAFDQITDPLFVFDNKFDCLSIGSQIAITGQAGYHQIFQFFAAIQASAGTTLQTIRAAVPIENGAAFTTDCMNNSIILGKLRSIASRPYFAQLGMAQLEQTIAQRQLPIQVADVNGVRSIVYDRQQKWNLIKLLDDAFLRSDMTGHQYDVTAKRLA